MLTCITGMAGGDNCLKAYGQDFTKRQYSRIIRPNWANYRTLWNYALQTMPHKRSEYACHPYRYLFCLHKLKHGLSDHVFFVGEEERISHAPDRHG